MKNISNFQGWGIHLVANKIVSNARARTSLSCHPSEKNTICHIPMWVFIDCSSHSHTINCHLPHKEVLLLREGIVLPNIYGAWGTSHLKRLNLMRSGQNIFYNMQNLYLTCGKHFALLFCIFLLSLWRKNPLQSFMAFW